jgi:hypothetical protein
MRGYLIYMTPIVAPQAHLGIGHEPAGRANTSFPHPALLKLHLDNYLSRSLASQRPQKISLKKCPAHRVAPWKALSEVWEWLPLSCRMLTVGPLGVVTEIQERLPPTQKKIDGGPTWETVSEVPKHPPSTQKNIYGESPRGH